MKRMLLVDDDIDVLDCLSIFFQQDYVLRMAENGADALALLAKERFDLVILDLMMPVLDGGALIDELRRRNIEVPVLLASAHAGLAKMARQMGAVDHIRKPYDLSELARKVARASGGDSGGASTGATGVGGGSSGGSGGNGIMGRLRSHDWMGSLTKFGSSSKVEFDPATVPWAWAR